VLQRLASKALVYREDAMRYWTRPVHLRYEAHRRVERLCLWIAHRLPGQLRMWVVVDSTNVARRLYPDPTGYAGPNGLGYSEIHDGALRVRRRKSPDA
jgi:hypothetical protein